MSEHEYDEYADVPVEELREQLDRLRQALFAETAQVTGYDPEDLEGLSTEDLQALHEDAQEQEQEAADEQRIIDAVGVSTAAAQAGQSVEQFIETQTREQVMDHARRTGDWGPYLKWKSSSESNLDRSTEQGSAGRQVKPWWPDRSER